MCSGGAGGQMWQFPRAKCWLAFPWRAGQCLSTGASLFLPELKGLCSNARPSPLWSVFVIRSVKWCSGCRLMEWGWHVWAARSATRARIPCWRGPYLDERSQWPDTVKELCPSHQLQGMACRSCWACLGGVQGRGLKSGWISLRLICAKRGETTLETTLISKGRHFQKLQARPLLRKEDVIFVRMT